MKFVYIAASGLITLVAPFTGAWIEITAFVRAVSADLVAPFTGAWIEILSVVTGLSIGVVAPFTGAWIEIIGLEALTPYLLRSLPSRERGLKSPHIITLFEISCRSLHGSVD